VKAKILLLMPYFLIALNARAEPVLGVGTPANSFLATPSAASPTFGTLINFDDLTPNSMLSSGQYSSKFITSFSSPSTLSIIPFSTQSGPNELFVNSGSGSANLSIQLANGTNQVGIGIADSDPVTITLQALNASGAAFGSAFSINLSTMGDPANPGNGYFTLTDSTADIFGLRIMQTASSPNFSGLAVDDVQFTPAPEPNSIALLSIAALAVSAIKSRKRV
jgi:hypothetical protein